MLGEEADSFFVCVCVFLCLCGGGGGDGQFEGGKFLCLGEILTVNSYLYHSFALNKHI